MKKRLLFFFVGLVCSLVAMADETIYSMTNPTGPTANLDSKKGSDLTATYVNGTGYVYNGKSSGASMVTNGQVNLGGSGNSYLKITISNGEIKVGDVIDVANGTTSLVKDGGTALYISTSTTKGSSKFNFPYTVKTGDAFVGKSELYFWKDGSNAFSVVKITGNRTSTNTPSFTTNLSTTPYEAVATKAFSLSVVAADATSLLWYSCDDAQKTNAQAIPGETKSTYSFTPVASDAGTTKYFYCVATNANATGEKNATSNVATVNIAENSSYVVTWQNVGGWSLRAPSGMTSGSEFDKNTTIALSADNGASYHFVGWTVNGEQVSTANAYTHTVTGAAEIKGVYEANKKLIFAGTNQEAYADKDGNITVPQNWYNYEEGKTVVSWTGSDGETYVPGEAKVLTQDVTLTPNYKNNKKQLAYGATVTWSFAFPNSAPLFNSIQGTGAVRDYVQQANINGSKIDVKMICDATAGKMDNARRMTNDLTQVNNNTKFTIPAVNGMVVKVNANANMSATTIAGSTSYTGSGTKNISYTYEGSDETIDIVIKDGSYLSSIVVVYPTTAEDPYKPTEIAKWDATNENKVGTWDFVGTATDAQDIKINTNTTNIKGVKFENGMIASDVLTNYAKVTVDGGFKAGDIVSFAGAYSNSGEKVATIALADADANVLFVSASCVNGRLSNDAPKVETYVLTSDMDELYIGRDASGKTTTYLTSFTITRPATVLTVNVNPTVGYATLYSEVETRMPANTKAYTATYNQDRSTVTLNEIEGKVIPAETAVVIEGKGGDFLYSETGAAAITGNDLKGTATAIAASSVEGGTVCVLGYENGNAGFFKFTGETLAANKAYLVVSGDPAAKALSIEIGGETTGIKNVSAVAKSGVMYNLAGQRVNADAKGMVIINGKVVIKK